MNKPLNNISILKQIEETRNVMPGLLGELALRAEIYHSYKKELTKAGFTDKEALEIIKARGLE